MSTGDRSIIIQEGRAAVLRAFRHDRKLGQSPLACFSGQRPATGKRKPRSKVAVAPERTKDGRAGRALRREMGYDEVHATATRASGSSKPALVDRQQISGSVHRAIAGLDPVQFLWIQYRYRPVGAARTAHGVNFERAYFRTYEAEHLVDSRVGTKRMVRYLIAVAMENESNPLRSVTPRGHDINPETWKKTYRRHWLRVCSRINDIDAEALYSIGLTIGPSGGSDGE